MGNEVLPIFVYGTLQRGECREGCWPHLPQRVEWAEIRGRLLDLGPYPALVSGDDRIRGELWTIAAEHLEETLGVLDRIEGCVGDAGDEYVRDVIECETAAGKRLAYVYRYADPGRIAAFPRVEADGAGACRWTRRNASRDV